MLGAGTWVGNFLGLQLVGAEVKRIADNERLRFGAGELADDHEARIGSKTLRHDERMQSRGPFGQGKRRGRDIHLAVADHDVAVRAESLYALVFVNVFVVRVQKVAVTHNEIDHWILSAAVTLICVRGQIRRIAAKDVENLPSVVISGGHLAVGVVVALTARPCKALDLISFGVLDQAKIRIRIATRAFKVKASFSRRF